MLAIFYLYNQILSVKNLKLKNLLYNKRIKDIRYYFILNFIINSIILSISRYTLNNILEIIIITY